MINFVLIRSAHSQNPIALASPARRDTDLPVTAFVIVVSRSELDAAIAIRGSHISDYPTPEIRRSGSCEANGKWSAHDHEASPQAKFA